MATEKAQEPETTLQHSQGGQRPKTPNNLSSAKLHCLAGGRTVGR